MSDEYIGATFFRDLAKLLDGKTEHDGVPVCRSVDEQLKASRPHLMVYKNGNVMYFYAPGCGIQWNPSLPIAEQPSKERGAS